MKGLPYWRCENNHEASPRDGEDTVTIGEAVFKPTPPGCPRCRLPMILVRTREPEGEPELVGC